jgi:glycosyltransferase involved in cell wall biosynthesis
LNLVASRRSQEIIYADPFEPESLAQAILSVIKDPDRQKELGSAAKTKAEQLWAPAVVAKQYAELYRSILSQSLGSHSSPRPDA